VVRRNQLINLQKNQPRNQLRRREYLQLSRVIQRLNRTGRT
jgi:hypothetical protein